MNPLIFLGILSILIAIYSILGYFASKQVHNTADYFLAGRSLGLWPVTFTLVATQLGGGMLLGTSQESYQVGLFGILYSISIIIGLFLLAGGIAARLQGLNVSTTAEIFETHYHSIALKKIASLLSIITLCGIFIAQIVASKTIIATLDTYQEPIFIIFWLLVILATMHGGLHAVVVTDTFQVLFIIMTFIAIVLYSIFQEPIWSMTSIINTQKTLFEIPTKSMSAFIMTLTMPALFSLIEQDLAQRFFAARSKGTAMLAALCAALFIFIFSGIPIYFGMKAKALGLVIPAGLSPLIPVIGVLTNDFIVACALCCIVAAITSTADSLLNAISSNIAQDFNFKLFSHNALNRSKLISFIVGITALILSYIVPQNIISLLISSYELSVSCLLVSLLYAYFRKDVKKEAALTSVITGFILFIAIRFWHADFPKELIPIIGSWISYVMVDRKKF